MFDIQVKSAISAYWQAPPAAVTAHVDLSGIASQICPVYKAIKPILDIVKTFVPGPWSIGIGIAEEAFDQVCGGAPSVAPAFKGPCNC
jgi:hypothetical protein